MLPTRVVASVTLSLSALAMGLSPAVGASSFTRPALTGYGSAIADPKGHVELTQDQESQSGSAWTSQFKGITDFTASFVYEVSGGAVDLGDGFAFAIQTESADFRGGAGGDLGFFDMGDAPAGNSLAVIFNSYDCGMCDPDPYIGVVDNADRGQQEELASGSSALGLIQGRHRAEIIRRGSVLTVKVDGNLVGTTTLTKSYANAWVGFTGGTGGATQRTRISSFKFSQGEFVSVAAGGRHSCALLDTGSVYCWGANGYGQLGDGTTTLRRTPVAVRGISQAVEIAAGGFHTCARTQSGEVYCWGANSAGQLGTGDSTNRSTATVVESDLDEITALATGSIHTCAITIARSALCWGDNSNGQLGNGTTTSSALPVAVTDLLSVVELDADYLQTCGRVRSGRVFCWGDNEFGQLGDGTTTDRSSAVQVPGVRATGIALGAYHGCATNRGAVLCWGSSPYGQLGNGTLTPSYTPVSVTNLARFGSVQSVTAMGGHTCAVKRDFTVACWGLNVAGALGDGTFNNRSMPTATLDVSQVKSIDSGYYHTCAITDGGTKVKCWGSNGYGQLGDNTLNDHNTAVVVAGLDRS